jgi:nitrogen fixation protein FixH
MRSGLRGSHVLTAFLAFFATVFLVDGLMIFRAVTTFGGLETTDAYRKGLAYNSRIAKGEAQARLGWRDKVAYVALAQRVRVDLTDSAGASVPGLALTGEIGRPATDRFDRQLAFTQTGPVTYEADAAGLEPGWWMVEIAARKQGGAEPLYEGRTRIWIKP